MAGVEAYVYMLSNLAGGHNHIGLFRASDILLQGEARVVWYFSQRYTREEGHDEAGVPVDQDNPCRSPRLKYCEVGMVLDADSNPWNGEAVDSVPNGKKEEAQSAMVEDAAVQATLPERSKLHSVDVVDAAIQLEERHWVDTYIPSSDSDTRDSRIISEAAGAQTRHLSASFVIPLLCLPPSRLNLHRPYHV